jgi:diguanylate cyclase (GGDEF)-like protein
MIDGDRPAPTPLDERPSDERPLDEHRSDAEPPDHEEPAGTPPARGGASGSLSLPVVEVHSLDPGDLERFLERRRANPLFPVELSLGENLVEILRKANEFVPSDAGSILLDNPGTKLPDRRANHLTFIAAFGERSRGLLGQTIPAHQGIAGHVYVSGRPYQTTNAKVDAIFYDGVDRQTRYTTQTLIAIPIRIEQEVCGVLELINRREQDDFSDQDRKLLEIFADYISISIQNVLDGRQAQEIAKRDNLTGLFNDRYLHVALSRAISGCRSRGQDLAVLFIDLDYFKRVNDTHGHLAGSQVLREVGRLLRRRLPAEVGVATRYGGDEFVLVVPGLSLEAAVDLAEEIRTDILSEVFCREAGEIQPEPLFLRGQTCSIGVATMARHAPEELPIDAARSTLLRLADTAMYVAKETGRNRTATAGEPVRRRN